MIFKNIFQIYTLLVCFICTIILIISASFLLNATTDLLIPQYKYYSVLLRYESNEKYLQHYEFDKDKMAVLKQFSSSQLAEKRVRDKKEYLEEEKGKAISVIINSSQWILIAVIFFLIHWRLYKRSTNKS